MEEERKKEERMWETCEAKVAREKNNGNGGKNIIMFGCVNDIDLLLAV